MGAAAWLLSSGCVPYVMARARRCLTEALQGLSASSRIRELTIERVRVVACASPGSSPARISSPLCPAEFGSFFRSGEVPFYSSKTEVLVRSQVAAMFFPHTPCDDYREALWAHWPE